MVSRIPAHPLLILAASALALYAGRGMILMLGRLPFDPVMRTAFLFWLFPVAAWLVFRRPRLDLRPVGGGAVLAFAGVVMDSPLVAFGGLVLALVGIAPSGSPGYVWLALAVCWIPLPEFLGGHIPPETVGGLRMALGLAALGCDIMVFRPRGE